MVYKILVIIVTMYYQTSERQVRPLINLEASEQRRCWEQAVKAAGGKVPDWRQGVIWGIRKFGASVGVIRGVQIPYKNLLFRRRALGYKHRKKQISVVFLITHCISWNWM